MTRTQHVVIVTKVELDNYQTGGGQNQYLVTASSGRIGILDIQWTMTAPPPSVGMTVCVTITEDDL